MKEYVTTITTLLAEVETIKSEIQNMLDDVKALQAKSAACCDPTGNNDEKNQKGVELKQNIPNPFDFTTRIDFALSADAKVLLEISDSQGKVMRTLANGDFNAGNHTVTFDGSGLAPGVYYYALYADGVMISKRMLKL